MQYILLIYSNESAGAAVTPAERGAMMAEYGAFTKGIVQAGNFKAGDALQPSSTAVTVRVRDGRTLNTDGPFAETREQLGGYYVITAANLDEATAIAARIPAARFGCVEVRPLMVLPPEYAQRG